MKRTDYLRPCMVNGKRALFHCWTQEAQVMRPALLRGGAPGGQLSSAYGIVEYEDGTVRREHPSVIRFLDHHFDEYCWEEYEHESQKGTN